MGALIHSLTLMEGHYEVVFDSRYVGVLLMDIAEATVTALRVLEYFWDRGK